MKRNYKGLFTFPHKVAIMFSWAKTPKQAKMLMLRRLAKIDGVPIKELVEKFKEHGYTIKEEE